MKTLNDLKPGEIGLVRKVHGEGGIQRRIQDMGIIRGSRIEMIKRAPLGDPIELKIRGYDLMLRQDEAKLVEIE